MKTDTLFYRLFQTRPQLLFDLLEIELPVASAYRFQSIELKQTAFRLDGVFIPPLNSPTAPLFFVEVQFQPDLTFYHRFFSEIFLYLRQFNPPNPWQAVVIYPTRTVDTAKILHHAVLLDSPQVNRLYLDELN
ncbi:MAG: Rpn family recombination-promoting nuclease/putative transposase, partial [Pseudanabaenales cyanobacterium]|nr:Rpn family recombination-promoting nuclease/putative transposase [Pseudanabaenales cyanobacterium]